MNRSIALGSVALVLATSANAAMLTAFSENFENGLSKWTGIGNGPITQAAIKVDPLNASNHVLGFTQLGSGGSIYTVDTITATGTFTVSFDYLGMPGLGGTPGNLGGFFGVSQAFPGSHYWVAGTGGYPAPIDLIDDGAWHHYSLTFSSPVGQVVRLMYEDYIGSGGVAGDVYFDNVQFNDSTVPPAPLTVPEPSGLLLAAVALLGLRASHRRGR